MARPLTIDELSDVITQHPAAIGDVAAQGTITVDAMAYAVSKMAIDPEVGRTLVAMATGVPREQVTPGLGCWMQALAIATATLRAHQPEELGLVFYRAVAPGFGGEVGTVQ